jgi:hypothetical protein
MVSCILTSGAACLTGNPATSNTITMVVTNVPVTREIQNITVTATQCFDASQTITLAANGTTFSVAAGGNATLIAGQNIIFYPGAAVLQNGYLLGQIVPGGPFCPPPAKSSIIAGNGEHPVKSERPFFRLYPNPTTGNFTLALNGYIPSEKVNVEIYNTNGDVVLSTDFVNEMKHDFSLSGRPSGLYLVRITSGNMNGSSRIVKID